MVRATEQGTQQTGPLAAASTPAPTGKFTN